MRTTLLAKRVAGPIDMWRIIDELRDPWAIVLAESLVFFLDRAQVDLGQALAAGLSVLVVRVVLGVLFGKPPPPALRLTSDEKTLAKYVLCDHLTDAQIAVLLGVPERSVGKRLRPILAKLGCSSREELESWAAATDFCHVQFHERPDVRLILTIAAFIGFGWTLFQILRTACQATGLCST